MADGTIGSFRTVRFATKFDELCDAFEAAWRQGPTPQLEEFLVQFPGDNSPELFGELLHLDVSYRRLRGEVPQSDEYLARFPSRAEAIQAEFQKFVDASTVDPFGTHGKDLHPAPAAVSRPNSAPRFRVVRPHKAGGLGEVFLATDEELGRPVALKCIKSEFLDHTKSRDRFVREATITGKLEHPSIVPVYGFGVDEAGRPYYAMRFIEGETLQAAVDRFHQAPLGENSRVEFRKLLQHFLDVCNAIEYAHSRDVIHRDLKPENVMLGSYGETLVVDWGLAKRLHGDEESPDVAEAVQAVRERLNSGQTKQGTTLGTLAFMSPEQAAGDVKSHGRAADVYGLGATLYMLLTGTYAFVPGPTAEILARIKRGEFPRPRQVRPTVAPALEAVCLKAMALKPGDRYPSAAAVAADVQRWLADERVSVHRERVPEKLLRWTRKHRAAFAGGAALVVAGLVASMIGLVLLHQEQLRTEQQREFADQERKKSDSLARSNAELAESERQQRLLFQRQALNLRLDQALAECRRQPALGVTQLAHCLQAAVDAESPDLEQVIRMQLAAWLMEVHHLRAIFPAPAAGLRSFFAAPSRSRALAVGTDGDGLCWDWSEGPDELRSIKLPEIHGPPLEISPDGRFAFYYDADRKLLSYDLDRRATHADVVSVPTPIYALKFSGDGRHAWICRSDGKAGVLAQLYRRGEAEGRLTLTAVLSQPVALHIPSGRLPIWLSGAPFPVDDRRVDEYLAFSDDGSSAFFLNAAGRVEGRRVSDGELVGPPIRAGADTVLFAPSKDGKRIYTATLLKNDSTLRAWDVATGDEISVNSAAAPYSRHLRAWGSGVLTANFQNVSYWTPGLAAPQPWVSLPSLEGYCVDSAGKRMAVSSLTNSLIQIRRIPGGERIGAEIPLKTSAVAFDADGRLITRDDLGRIWSVAEGAAVRNFHGRQVVYDVDVRSGQQQQLLVAAGNVQVVDGKTGRQSGEFGDVAEHIVKVDEFAEGSRLLLRKNTGVRLCDAQGKPQSDWLPCDLGIRNQLVHSKHTWFLTYVRTGNRLRVHDGTDGRAVGDYEVESAQATAVSPVAELVAVTSNTGVLLLLDISQPAAPKLLRRFVTGVNNICTSLGFSPGGEYLAAGFQDGKIFGVDMKRLEVLETSARHNAGVDAIGLAHNAQGLLAASVDGQVQYWSFPALKPVGPAFNCGGSVSQLCFSPDDSVAAIATSKGRVELKETVSWRTLGNPLYDRPLNGWSRAMFMPGGRSLLTHQMSTVEIWRLPTRLGMHAGQCVALVERATGLRQTPDGIIRPLTLAEWQGLPPLAP